MSRKLLIFALMIFVMAACSKARVSEESAFALKAKMSGQEADKYLATEHYYTIDIKEEDIVSAYQSTIEACRKDMENNCAILDARISKGRSPSAFIRVRIKPEGVKAIVEVASSKGKIIEESTHSEDLAKPIVDTEKRLKMLTNHREKLLALEEKTSNDIDALIKVSSELSQVQSDLEAAMGQHAYLLQRVNMEIVNISFQVKSSRSFWKPVVDSLSDFSSNLSDGLAGTVTAVAYLLPALILILLLVFCVRFAWRKTQRK